MDLAPRWWQRLACAAVVDLLFFGGYGLANRLVSHERCLDLTTSWDRAIPLVPELVFPFYLAYGLLLAPALLVDTRRLLWRAALAFALLIGVSCALFFLLPVTVPRPAALPDTLAGALLARIYAADRPVCGFPSLHVSASVLAALVLGRARRSYGVIFGALALATSAATLFVKQHVLLDVAGGVALAIVVFAIVIRGRRSSPVGLED